MKLVEFRLIASAYKILQQIDWQIKKKYRQIFKNPSILKLPFPKIYA